MAEEPFRAPQIVYLCGAGRWARVILSILLRRLPSTTEIYVVSSSHIHVIQDWLASQDESRNVKFATELPEEHITKSAVIVANAVPDHFATAKRALSSGFPVLVEKPLAPTTLEIGELMEFAASRDAYLAAAHVFLFARYLYNFGVVVRGNPLPTEMTFTWTDTHGEYRYGEQKTTHSSVPIVMDVFPHILSALRVMWPDAPISYSGVALEKGHVLVKLLVSGVPCRASLSRKGMARVRRIGLRSAASSLALDFSTEPGTIITDGESYSADLEWSSRPGPLSLELETFLDCAVEGRRDDRLSPELAYEASLLVSQILDDWPSGHPKQ
jgi:predicted dehydrogenase